MGDTVRPEESPFALEVVPAIGTGLSGIAMAGILVPIQRGVRDPAIVAAVVLALLATAAFLARRYGILSRSTGGAIAAGASLGVVLLSGYALNQGITGHVALPVGSISLSLVFGTFLAASGAIGMAVADRRGIRGRGVLERTRLTVGLAVVGIVGLFSAYLVVSVLALPMYLVFGGITDLQGTVLSQLATAIGTMLVAVGYLVATDREWSFLDVRVPSLRDVKWIVGGIVVLFGTLFAISVVMSSVGVESSNHSTTELAENNPEVLLVLVPAAILIIGPFEELLYRNVIQKTMYEVFSRSGAVVVGSVVFASVHLMAYDTGTLGGLIASLGVVFGLSLVLGFIYERTDNLVVPALVHGVYNAIVFANLYLTYG
ncbi:CPBP family glutamic-type intramembrane protease [Halomontanus rarus]|uniref:CPBP family glutamic-type intramembrane protease n=1 Tax=Halomontanus rarus TaxID=3034020 RepID=UPI001A99A83D